MIKMQIIPSILEYSVQSFENRLNSLINTSSHFQIDIVDDSIDKPTLTSGQVLEILTEKNCPNKTFEFHLMVNNPYSDIEVLSSSPVLITKIYIHHLQLLNLSENTKLSICVDLHPEDDIKTLPLKIFDSPSIQIMTVDPGKQGNPFIPSQLKKIEALRKRGYKGTVYIDGGIGENEAHQISKLEFKPQGIVVGSFLHNSPDQKITILENVFST